MDIVATKGGTLAVVEVKHRQQPLQYAADGASLLNPLKLRALRRGAGAFLVAHPAEHRPTVRFDLAVVSPGAGRAPWQIDYYVNI